ncbi:MAG: 30S ribosomal protein S27e [Candidatus Woesearchaeota archaeon]
MKTRLNPVSKFVKVRCSKCNNEQIIFDKSSTYVKCLICETPIAKPTGGKAKLINSQVLEVLD